MPQLHALFFASFGNILAITVNYLFGYLLYEKTQERLHKSKIGVKSLKLGRKYGYFSILFSWIPIFGDPLTFVAGLLRMNFLIFFFVAGFLRILRYHLLTFVL